MHTLKQKYPPAVDSKDNSTERKKRLTVDALAHPAGAAQAQWIDLRESADGSARVIIWPLGYCVALYAICVSFSRQRSLPPCLD